MKVSEAINRIDARWVRKPKGFRVRFDIFTDGRWCTDYSPEQNAPPLNSAVMAWRFAWKLAQTCEVGKAPYEDGDIANIFVVDDQGERVRSYITDGYDVYHPQEELSPKQKAENSSDEGQTELETSD